MEKTVTVPIAHIEPFRDRARDPERFKMLVSSIAKYGLIEPVILAPNEQGSKRKYRLIAGHGRLQAVKKLGWQKVQAVVRETFQLTDFIIENWRRDLSPYEAAVLVELELRMGKSESEIAEKFSITEKQIDTYATVVRSLHPELQRRVKARKLPMNTAARLAQRVPRPVQETVVQAIIKEERERPSESVVKTVVSDILSAIKVKGSTDGLDSVEKIEKLREEVKSEYEDSQKAVGILRSHYIQSYVELKRVLKEPSVRSVFDKAGIDYKAVQDAE